MRFFEPRGPQPRPSGGPQLVSLVRALRRLPPESRRRNACFIKRHPAMPPNGCGTTGWSRNIRMLFADGGGRTRAQSELQSAARGAAANCADWENRNNAHASAAGEADACVTYRNSAAARRYLRRLAPKARPPQPPKINLTSNPPTPNTREGIGSANEIYKSKTKHTKN